MAAWWLAFGIGLSSAVTLCATLFAYVCAGRR